MSNYPKSDHFNGSRFFNPTNPKGNGLWAGLKMLCSLRLEKWPKTVENSPALELDHPLNEHEVAITFVNHATFLIQTKDFNFLTDPVWAERVSPVSWAGPKRHRAPGIPFEKLPKIDFVMISHDHYDHMDISAIKRLNNTFQPTFFVPLGNKNFLETKGIQNIIELDWWQSLQLSSNLQVSLAPAEHFSGRSPFNRNKTLWGSYIISYRGHTLFFGADSAYAAHFTAIQKHFGAPDIAFLPIGAYEPRWFMKVVHMNPAEAVQAHLDLKATQSIGIHFGTFQLTSERMDQPLIDLSAALKARNVPEHEFITLREGQTQVFALKKAKL